MILQFLDLESFIVNRRVNQFSQVMASWQNKTISQFYERIRNKVFYCLAGSCPGTLLAEFNAGYLDDYQLFLGNCECVLCSIIGTWGGSGAGSYQVRLHYCGNVKTDKLHSASFSLRPLVHWPGLGQDKNSIIISVTNSWTWLVFSKILLIYLV